jgi:hypothetical protein
MSEEEYDAILHDLAEQFVALAKAKLASGQLK